MSDASGQVEFSYIELEDVLVLYANLFSCTLAQAADQLRSRSGLEGALARPEQYAHYQDADISLQAAVLAHGIAEGQYFLDGNKRIALLALLTFLRINGYDLNAGQQERAAWIFELSAGLAIEELAIRIKNVVIPL